MDQVLKKITMPIIGLNEPATYIIPEQFGYFAELSNIVPTYSIQQLTSDHFLDCAPLGNQEQSWITFPDFDQRFIWIDDNGNEIDLNEEGNKEAEIIKGQIGGKYALQSIDISVCRNEDYKLTFTNCPYEDSGYCSLFVAQIDNDSRYVTKMQLLKSQSGKYILTKNNFPLGGELIFNSGDSNIIRFYFNIHESNIDRLPENLTVQTMTNDILFDKVSSNSFINIELLSSTEQQKSNILLYYSGTQLELLSNSSPFEDLSLQVTNGALRISSSSDSQTYHGTIFYAGKLNNTPSIGLSNNIYLAYGVQQGIAFGSKEPPADHTPGRIYIQTG